MAIHCHRLGERALGQQDVAARRPASQLRAGSGIAGIDETALRSGQRDRHAFSCVRHREGLEVHVGIEREWLTVPYVQYTDGEAGMEQPIAITFGQRAQELHDSRRAENHQRLLAHRLRRVLERVHEHGQLAPMVRMKMRYDDMADLIPGQSEFCEPVEGSGATVEQHAQIAAAHPMAGGRAAGGWCNRSCADGDEFHAHFPRKTIRLNSSKPGALSLARYTPGGNRCPSSARPSHMSRGSQMPVPPALARPYRPAERIAGKSGPGMKRRTGLPRRSRISNETTLVVATSNQRHVESRPAEGKGFGKLR